MKVRLTLGTLAGAALLVGCMNSSDESANKITREEFYAMSVRSGSPDQEKVIICHIPPGNPEAAHTITVGFPAVQAHVDHHEDTLGACGDGGGGGGGGSGGGGTGGGGTGGGGNCDPGEPNCSL